MKKTYLDMVKLTNSSESFLEGFKEAQIEVGNLVWVSECVDVFMFRCTKAVPSVS